MTDRLSTLRRVMANLGPLVRTIVCMPVVGPLAPPVVVVEPSPVKAGTGPRARTGI